MKPVLILGAGINGAAVARDLAINGIPVCIVDSGDIARGATSRSSRLIHGGLRYLEYRDTELVRESLQERERLLTMAPHFVKPLRLIIPVTRRFGGLWAGLIRFSGLGRTSFGQTLLKIGRGARGLLAVRAGLAMYDRLARTGTLPGHQIQACDKSNMADSVDSNPGTPSQKFHWMCSYWDAQIEYPERFVLALLEDGRRAAQESDTQFDVLPYHKAIALESSAVLSIEPIRNTHSDGNVTASQAVEPSIIINATGAWGDYTLEALGLREPRLFAGTKGSHLYTSYTPLLKALNGQGVYAEAQDGRLIFILPCAAGVLIGTTDDPYSEDPGIAVSTPSDMDYLIEMVNEVFPNVRLSPDHVSMHHAGVRPLPRCDKRSMSAIPRGHSIKQTNLNGIPILTLIGGKLTTCRSLAEEVCSIVCSSLSHPHTRNTTSRPIPGAEKFPVTAEVETWHQAIAERYALSREQVATVSKLIGNRFNEVFENEKTNKQTPTSIPKIHESITGTNIPQAFVRWSIEHEWCTKLEDLVERRLILIFAPHLRRTTLHALAAEFVKDGLLDQSAVESEVESVCQRLQQFYGKTIMPD